MNTLEIYFTAGSEDQWPGITYEKVVIQINDDGTPVVEGESVTPWKNVYKGAPSTKEEWEKFQIESASKNGQVGRYIPTSASGSVISVKK